MKKINLLFLSILIIFTLSLPVSATVDISSDCAIVMDIDTGQVLYDKNGYQVNNMGNMTKLLNVSTALNNAEIGKMLSVTANCLAETTQDSLAGSIGLKEGQSITLEDALYGEILSNANDAARVVAGNLGHTEESSSIGTAEDVKNYLKMMRQEANYLTASSLSIASVMGMWSPDQVCSTMDLANIFRLGFEDSTFRRIVTAKEKDITVYTQTRQVVSKEEEPEETPENSESGEKSSNKDQEEDSGTSQNNTKETTTEVVTSSGESTTLTSGHSMVNGTINNRSVKGGFAVATDTGYSSVTYIKRNIENDQGEAQPRKLVVAIMNSPSQEAMYEDIEALTDYGLSDWKAFALEANKLDSYLPDDLQDKDIVFPQDMNCLLPENIGQSDLKAEVAVNENNFCGGTITFTVKDNSHPVYVGAFYEDDNQFVLNNTLRVILYILVALLVLGIIFLILRFVIIPNYNKAKNKKVAAGAKPKGNRPRKPGYKKNNSGIPGERATVNKKPSSKEYSRSGKNGKNKGRRKP